MRGLFARARSFARALLRRSALVSEMEEEFRLHIDLRTEDLIRSGLSPAEAARRARLEFGSMDRFREEGREARGLRFFDELRQDLRLSARSLRKQPGMTLLAVLSIAIGVGATTAVYGLMNAVLFRPLDVPAADRLFAVTEFRTGAFWQGVEGPGVPYSRYVAYREATAGGFSGLAAQRLTSFSLRTSSGAVAVAGALTSGNYFAVLGVRPAAGRFFGADDEHAVVLAHHLWRDRFEGDPGAVGATVYLDGEPFTVVGVAPRGFGGTIPGLSSDVWVPVAAARTGDALRSMSSWVAMFGRLRPEVGAEGAAALVDVVARRTPPDEPQTRVRGAGVEPLSGMLRGGARGAARTLLALLLGSAVVVLLIACANIAGMLLARGLSRRREVAIRLAVGAGRRRLVRQLLTESAVLALIGGAGGVLLAGVGFRLASTIPLPFSWGIVVDPAFDGRVLGFSLAATVATVILFGLVPALEASAPTLVTALRDGGWGGTAPSARGRSLFVAGQLTMAVLLLVVAGLFLHSFERVLGVELGYDPDGVVIATTDLGPHGYDERRGRAFYAALVERLRAVAGVEDVAVARSALLDGAQESNDMETVGPGAVRREWGVAQNKVDPAFFATLRLPVVAGRGFSDADREGAPPVTIVDQALARRFWPGESPLGQRVRTYGGELEVVGVVSDGRYDLRDGSPSGYAFFPFAQRYSGRMTLHVRARMDAADLVRRIRREVAALDPDVAVEQATSLSVLTGRLLAPQRALTTVLAVFALVGVVLAGIGVYGVLAFQVARQAREFGIRIALGAPTRAVIGQVLRRGGRLALVGVALGLALGAAASFVLGRFLYAVTPLDPATFVGVALVLALVAVAASFVPVRRATRVDPITILRAE